jgi:2-polyprenyl-6-methoxyphenol hydroxylase-like FAD-dependent oxidoreductase
MSEQNVPGRRQAVVIGSSMAGMLAAGVLARHFARVTVIERDQLPDEPTERKGVPQARHFHGLLARGGEIIEALFPGVTTDVGEAGAIYTDAAQGLKWFHHDTWRVRFHSGVQGYLSSRPLLEATVRRHLRNVGNVRLLDGCTVTGLTAAAGGARVTGVRIQRGEGPEETLEADLVVDAAGRGTRATLRDP